MCNYVLIAAQGLHGFNEVNTVSVGSSKTEKEKKKLQKWKFNIYGNTHKSIRKSKAELIMFQYPGGEKEKKEVKN